MRQLEMALVGLSAGLLASESALGLRQVFGDAPSRNALFPITGHFENPGPFGGFVAVLLAITTAWCVLHQERFRAALRCRSARAMGFLAIFGFSAAASCLGGVVLVASMSRTAIVGFLLATGVFIGKEYERLGLTVLSKRKTLRTFAVACLILSIPLFLTKRDSALGRFHIWHMEMRTIAEQPLGGAGWGRSLGAYGRTQARYFAEKERPALIQEVAGCPEFAFNEYLRAGMEGGVPALLGILALTACVLALLFRRKSPFAYGAVVLAVFSFGSYPFSLWQFRLTALAFLLLATVGSMVSRRKCFGVVAVLSLAVFAFAAREEVMLERRRDRLKTEQAFLGNYSDAEAKADACARLYPDLKEDYRYLYGYGYILFQCARYEEALTILAEGAERSCDPMFHNIMGRCHEAQGQLEAAEREYLFAHYMVPCRLYPLVLLKEMYIREGRRSEAESIVRISRRIRVNPRSGAMLELKRRMEEVTDE